MGITSQLATFVAEIRLEDLPAEVAPRARNLLIDLIGNTVRARHEAESTDAMLSAGRELGWGQGQSRVFGDEAGYSPACAAFLNGALAHSLDFDDTHMAGALHPGCTVIPAALAAAEIVHAPAADLLAAIVGGYDVACRLALSLPAAEHFARGFQPTTTCGVFGAAAAAARVFGLSPSGIEAAMGIALSQASGSPQYTVNGAWTKRFQTGWAAMAGLTAATLARKGFHAPVEALEGRYGFFQRDTTSDPTRAVQDLGTRFELMETGVKPYPSCRFGHAGIDAAIIFREATRIDPARIERVVLGISAFGLDVIGKPIERQRDPQSVVDGQFSAPFMLAVALTTGGLKWDDFRRLQDPAIRALLPRIDCVIDSQAEAAYPASMAGTLTVIAEGRTWRYEVLVPKGEPSCFLTDDEIEQKFMSLSVPVVGGTRAREMTRWARALAVSPNGGSSGLNVAPS